MWSKVRPIVLNRLAVALQNGECVGIAVALIGLVGLG